ncbi:glycosyltransferase family 4 protein [Dictyoglomus thermophilum]|uniref:Undecaprenyl-phosphate n=1 Tax=Dictyoglomus thermophilum (strain ATCC 35947 / DSM 3960 / H-6-12) TaxID=309799 RepID=B5YE75_DICT6|nr:MraY family glycosyltransferase [Dictyoglomus thermophilum]ACI18847.1 undecaprenyl-phosphate [Dictyoglomus thermophilum H-6-12]MCX7720981.1 undecaprenyl/decaprenyl-phosphate alpha-N-acetylglucosaminyl 1-phosphate transferase [Dictyoglomus thermophilum]TYT22444.1 undecaprenyl/decaprenyl-phosphate alpha-N-acetylglucosaminyl 1-phosphate transferase [Dictyoglomus thermophilum]
MMALLTFVLSLIGSILFTPWVKKIAYQVGAVDIPNDRKVHLKPIPRIGGVAFFLSILIVNVLFNKSLIVEKIIFGGLLVFLVGLLDDFVELKPKPKFWLTFLAVLIAVFIGVRVDVWRIPYTKIIIKGFWADVITFVWLLGITNAMNFIDGLDGLAGGVAVISSFSLLIISLLLGRFEMALLLSSILGSVLGFLFYNFPPASIFMGDSGAMFLGFILGAISIIGVLKVSTIINLFFPIVVLGFPVLDTAFSIIRRLLEGRAPWKYDKDHLHHRFLRIGMKTEQSIAFIYLITICMSLLAIIISLLQDPYISAILLFGTLFLILFILKKLGVLEVRRNGKV